VGRADRRGAETESGEVAGPEELFSSCLSAQGSWCFSIEVAIFGRRGLAAVP
jgi:hypothetical protein